MNLLPASELGNEIPPPIFSCLHFMCHSGSHRSRYFSKHLEIGSMSPEVIVSNNYLCIESLV